MDDGWRSRRNNRGAWRGRCAGCRSMPHGGWARVAARAAAATEDQVSSRRLQMPRRRDGALPARGVRAGRGPEDGLHSKWTFSTPFFFPRSRRL